MTSLERSTHKTITFSHPFVLDKADGDMPAGRYDVETEEELIPTLSFMAYRRGRTTITSPATARGIATQRQVLTVDPILLDAALAKDQAQSLREAVRPVSPQNEDFAMSPIPTPASSKTAGPKPAYAPADAPQFQKHNLIASAPVLVPLLIVASLAFITWYRPPAPTGAPPNQVPQAAVPTPAR